MDAALFTKMLSDKSVLDLKKLGYKYPQADMGEFVSLLKNGFLPSAAAEGLFRAGACLFG